MLSANSKRKSKRISPLKFGLKKYIKTKKIILIQATWIFAIRNLYHPLQDDCLMVAGSPKATISNIQYANRQNLA